MIFLAINIDGYANFKRYCVFFSPTLLKVRLRVEVILCYVVMFECIQLYKNMLNFYGCDDDPKKIRAFVRVELNSESSLLGKI